LEGLSLTFKQYNWEQERLTKRYQERIARNKAIYTGGLVKVKKVEVQERLKKLGVNIHWDTVLNWERAGLLPKSKMVGREKDFPTDYYREVYAAYQLKQGKLRLTNKNVKVSRDIALNALNDKNGERVLFEEALEEGDKWIALQWLQEKIKAHPEYDDFIKRWLRESKEGQKYQTMMKRLREIENKHNK